MKITITLLSLIGLLAVNLPAQEAKPPVRFAMVGLTHDHALGLLSKLNGRTDVQLAGIVETNDVLIARYTRRFHLGTNLFYPTLADLLAHTNASAVAIFTSTFDHARVVADCAAQGVGVVMMEKPMAVNMTEARAIAATAKNSGTQIIVNYETTWYPGNQAAYTMVHDEQQIGGVWRMVFHHGHRGPQEIGCSQEFLAWLTDPVLNGGGALNDFGCYGADLATWLMDGQRPVSVLATTQHLKPDVYPKVEDDATIVVTYPHTQVIIQASWNWPFDRKDMELYGKTGYVLVPQPNVMKVRTAKTTAETEITPPSPTGTQVDQLALLAGVVHKETVPSGPSSLEENLVVVEILDAAHESANTGKRVDF